MVNKINNQMMINNTPLPVELIVAKGFLQRLKGLLFTESLSEYHGLYIKPCSMVHSFGMAYPLDLVFLNDESKVVKLDNLQTRSIQCCRGATAVIELSQGGIEQHGIKLGDHLSFGSEVEYEGVLS